ncbi:DUF986 family protein [[Erwinia] mediterraneensis]|uniref:DUF986 family protein n=1 Tax=[Erwinia] mediterraneensis TaxID=2161819 RepID=UPI0010311C00|nr:DUF986 family protein [[Erwinia] mediterraneensis]
MSLTEMIILLFIVLLAAYAFYDEVIMPQRKGPTRLLVVLKRGNKLDSLIFIALLVILLGNNLRHQGPQLTTTLLLVLTFLAVWLFWIRRPRLLLKDQGMFYANAWIAYHRIQSMNLSEDGILLVQLEQRRLLIAVRQLDDLERIYHTLVEIR